MRVSRLADERREGNSYEAHIYLEGGGTETNLHDLTAKQVGRFGEDVAAALLEHVGLEVLERNWTCSFGEVDIIARDDDGIVLVEVKSRRSKADDHEIVPELAVDNRKRNRYQKLALVYLSKEMGHGTVRFDVAALRLPNAREAQVRYLRGAYDWDR